MRTRLDGWGFVLDGVRRVKCVLVRYNGYFGGVVEKGL